MKYNLFEIIGIYVVCKEIVLIGKEFVRAINIAWTKHQFIQHGKELEISLDRLKKFDDEDRRRDKLVLDMYREGYSRQEILDHFGEKWIGKDRVERVCDEEDHSWDAEA